ncbi:MAG: phosphatase PAP2 family protein [Opitutae bacterium]|nr:phosphatase PAP2 family protein [Opitutae bacterium]
MTLGLLAAMVALFEFTGLDLALQDHFYNFETGRWLVDAKDPAGRAVFYNGPKALVWVVGLGALALAAGPARWRDKFRFDRRGLWLAVLCIATVPALAGIGKSLTNVFCPSEIRRYGGDVAYAKLCEPFPADDRPERKGGCFPAGHASGGFALMGLLALRASRRWRYGAIALGLGLGWWMGLYQMLKGAHYLSHTLTTMFVAWLVVLLWRRVLRI